MPQPGNPGSLNRYSYVLNNPLRYTDPTGQRPTAGCEYEGCTLPAGLPPESTWLLPNGAYALVDPQLVAAYDYKPLTEGVLPAVAMLFGWAAAPSLVGAAVANYAIPIVQAGLRGLGLACADGDCGNEASHVVNFARSLQGSGRYPGVDQFSAMVLQEGEVVVGGLPGQSHFYTALESLQRAGGSAETLWKGLQVAPHREEGYRTIVGVYRVLSDVLVATGQALANTRFGPGGYTQYVIENYPQVLDLLYTVTLQ